MHAMLALSRGRLSLKMFLPKSWINWCVLPEICLIDLKCIFNLVDLLFATHPPGWANSSSFVVHADSITSYRCFSNIGKKMTYPMQNNNIQVPHMLVDMYESVNICCDRMKELMFYLPWILESTHSVLKPYVDQPLSFLNSSSRCYLN